jgi:hypothetical protein
VVEEPNCDDDPEGRVASAVIFRRCTRLLDIAFSLSLLIVARALEEVIDHPSNAQAQKPYAGAGPNVCHTALDSAKQNSVVAYATGALQRTPCKGGITNIRPVPAHTPRQHVRLWGFPPYQAC